MPRLTQAEIRNNAVAFVHEWKGESRERAEAQTFWNEFLEIFGIKSYRINFECSVNQPPFVFHPRKMINSFSNR